MTSPARRGAREGDRRDGFVIRGGSVHDGTGRPPTDTDVLVRDGQIVQVTRDLAAAEGTTVLDARGLAVAPGFIDLHSHADLILTLPARARLTLQRGKLLQGITTEVIGNCGLGAAPLTAESEPPLRSVLAWMTPEGVSWSWRSFAEYMARLDVGPLPINVGVLAAHGPIRAAVLGFQARQADAEDAAAIAGLVREALDAGALGLSAGLIYPPGMHADTDELTAAAGVLAAASPAGRGSAEGGVFTCHIRGSSETLLPAVEELIEIGRRAGCAVHHSHSEAVGPGHWSKIDSVLALEERARREGLRVTCDLFPYHAAATMMSAIFPPWALEGGPGALLERLSDRGERARIRDSVEGQAPSWPPWQSGGWAHNLVLACGYERIFVSRTGGVTKGRDDGLSLEALGRARGTDPFEAIADLMIEERGEVGQWIFGISGEESDPAGPSDGPLLSILRSAHCAIATDACDYGRGQPHPAAYGTFPRILGRFVRERGVLSLPEAVRRMTSLPASILGLTDRGRVAPGLAADLVLFDPSTITDRATFAEPRLEADGVRHLLVNGRLAVHHGAITGIDGGTLLRRP